MKHFFYIAAAAAVTLGAATGCTGSTDNTAANDQSKSTKWVSELMTQDALYTGLSEADTATLRLSVDVEWPYMFGDASLGALQDTLQRLVLGYGGSVEVAMDSFIRDTRSYDFEVDTSITIDSDKPFFHAYMRSVAAIREELTPATVNYTVSDITYLGGAHPMTNTRTLTYVFDSADVVSPANLFIPASLPEVGTILNAAAAAHFDVKAGELTKAGLFGDSIYISPNLSISRGDAVFHYNQYDIAPYSYGPVDIYVPLGSLKEYLSPLGQQLLGDFTD